MSRLLLPIFVFFLPAGGARLFGAKIDYFSAKFDLFLRLIDNFDVPDSGITGNLELFVTETVFLSISGSSTLGVQYVFTDNNYRKTAGILVYIQSIRRFCFLG
jgi:hypothetical protein